MTPCYSVAEETVKESEGKMNREPLMDWQVGIAAHNVCFADNAVLGGKTPSEKGPASCLFLPHLPSPCS
jgi:hypothetical protein